MFAVLVVGCGLFVVLSVVQLWFGCHGRVRLRYATMVQSGDSYMCDIVYLAMYR